MADPDSAPEPSSDAALRQAASRLQGSGTLGEARLRKLFDYLLEKTLAGQSPKEIAIAIDVFGKTSSFDVSQDALVRVYIHKLRKALEDFYGSPAAAGLAPISLPRGEYRLKIEGKGLDSPAERSPQRRAPLFLISALLAVFALAGLWMVRRGMHPAEIDQVRASPVWSGILADDRPIMIVMGDYYLIGDTEDSIEVKRLVREYAVNSKSDLDRYLQENPAFAGRYMDVGLRYLPISAALALRNVMVVLAPQNRRITISKMSDLEPGSLKSADIVYIGYLSGMGMFQDFAFTGSRFAVGESYDEIIDKQTHRTYVSEVGRQMFGPPAPTGKEQSYRDYGIFQKLRGPDGNTILVIAGTRDEGVSQTAEAFTNAQQLRDLASRTNLSVPVEALLEVRAFNGTNLSGNVLLQSPRDKAK